MVKVSVIVPVYNMEKYVGECLDSIISQTLAEIEIIVINDGSTDKSLGILRDYARKDDRIKIIDKENAGVGAARNDGIDAANGEFIAFMDPDDMYASENVLLHCYHTAKNENVPVVGGKTVFLYPDGRREKEKKVVVGDVSFTASGKSTYTDYQYDYGYVCYIYRRDVIMSNGIRFPLYSRFQDPPFFVRAMISAHDFYMLDEPVYVYRQLYGKGKYTEQKTIDLLSGIMDNLQISKEHNLAKLHFVTAQRLNKEGSYMISKNMNGNRVPEIIESLIRATAMVDAEWLKKEGLLCSSSFYPEVFDYAFSTTAKYEKLRSNKLVRVLLGVHSRLFK